MEHKCLQIIIAIFGRYRTLKSLRFIVYNINVSAIENGLLINNVKF
jgi:hypothetical protein